MEFKSDLFLFSRRAVAHDVAALIEYKNCSLQEAVDFVVHKKLNKDDGGIIAVDNHANICMSFNSTGMFRGAADSKGRFEVAIWKDLEILDS